MDLGIAGRTAVVCASSRGLGKACAEALADAGVNLVVNGRSEGPLAETAAALRERYGVTVTAVAADATTDEGLAELVAACPAPDILVNNAGGPPPGDWRQFSREDWHKAIDSNLLSATFLIRAYADGMAERGFGRIVNITSGAVKAPIDVLGLSNGARSGLTGFVAGIARQSAIAGRNVTINNLLPGAFDTERLQKTMAAGAAKTGASADEMAAKRRAGIPAQRFGTAAEFGAICAMLCSAQAGYLTGQNILLDGGAYPGTF